MRGEELIKVIEDRLEAESGKKPSSQDVCDHLGLTPYLLKQYRGYEALTPKQTVGLMDRFARAVEGRLKDEAVMPIVEFFELQRVPTQQGRSYQIFPIREDGRELRFAAGLRRRLGSARGVYIFQDSRGRAIYAGKAEVQDLWTEMNNAYNRGRDEVQFIKKADHPVWKGAYRDASASGKQIVKRAVPLHEIAAYASVYEVADGMIGKVEALIVRAFANDLLNIRMEKL